MDNPKSRCLLKDLSDWEHEKSILQGFLFASFQTFPLHFVMVQSLRCENCNIPRTCSIFSVKFK